MLYNIHLPPEKAIDYLRESMDYMSIDYFSDLEFVCHGEMALSRELYVRENFKDYWGIQFARRGRFALQIGDNPPESTEGAALFLSFPGTRFEYGAADERGIENKIYVCFRGERVKRYLTGGLLQERQRNALLSPANPDEFLARMRRLRALIMLPEATGSHARAVLELENLLLNMVAHLPDGAGCGNVHYPDFATLTERIAASPEHAWDFAREAKKLSVSYAHFRRLFEQFFGTPPGAFLLAARLEKAAELLTGSALSIREIAHECGFEDEFYFSRSFSHHRGIAPKFYRNRQR